LFAPALLPAGYILARYAPDLFAPNALALRRFASRLKELPAVIP
jgi:hypothetical protein